MYEEEPTQAKEEEPAIESKPIEQATTPIDLEPYEVENAVDANQQ